MKTKTRLTITLSQDLLAKVDSLIDGHSARNRSHAIEGLVRKSLSVEIESAVILAGGNRENGDTPSLKKINKRYVLSIMIDQLKMFGVTKIIMCAGKNEKKIKDIFGDGSSHGINLIYSSESKPLGSAGTIKNAEGLIGKNPFLVINDNTLTNLNMDDLFEFHLNEDSIATVCVKPRMSEEKYGQAFLHGNKIVKFLDKSKHEGISIVNVGMYVLKPEIFELIEKDKHLGLESDIFPKLAEKKELSAFVFQGNWFDASKEISYKQAVKNWKD
jgi:NDP-sugar pyrophosphorylase family protein